MEKTFTNIEEFYSDDERRRYSGESDYGVWWKGDSGQDFPRWRVSYVESTGEVYAVKPGQVRVLGIVPPDPGGYYYRTLDRMLVGWAEACGAENIDWVRQRVKGGRFP